MSDEPIDSNTDVIFWFNKASGSNNGRYFRVQKHSSPTTVFEINEDGHVTLTGPLQRAAPLIFNTTIGGDGDVVEFKKGGVVRLSLTRFGSGTGSALSTHALLDQDLVLQAAGDIHFVLDHDDDSGSPNGFRLTNAASSARFEVLNSMTTRWYDNSGDQQAELVVGASDTELFLGQQSDGRGVLRVRRDASSGDERPGVFQFSQESGSSSWLWVDDDGLVRIHTADPGTDITAGTIVGTQ